MWEVEVDAWKERGGRGLVSNGMHGWIRGTTVVSRCL